MNHFLQTISFTSIFKDSLGSLIEVTNRSDPLLTHVLFQLLPFFLSQLLSLKGINIPFSFLHLTLSSTPLASNSIMPQTYVSFWYHDILVVHIIILHDPSITLDIVAQSFYEFTWSPLPYSLSQPSSCPSLRLVEFLKAPRPPCCLLCTLPGQVIHVTYVSSSVTIYTSMTPEIIIIHFPLLPGTYRSSPSWDMVMKMSVGDTCSWQNL